MPVNARMLERCSSSRLLVYRSTHSTIFLYKFADMWQSHIYIDGNTFIATTIYFDCLTHSKTGSTNNKKLSHFPCRNVNALTTLGRTCHTVEYARFYVFTWSDASSLLHCMSRFVALPVENSTTQPLFPEPCACVHFIYVLHIRHHVYNA